MLTGAFAALIAILLAFLAVFLYNTSVSGLYHDKIHTIAKQALAVYVNEMSWNGAQIPGATSAAAQTTTTNEVNSALNQMGLPNAQVTCSTAGTIATVTVSVQGLALYQSGLPLVQSINVQETLTADLSVYRKGISDMAVSGLGSTYMPVYGRFQDPWSNGHSALTGAPWYEGTFYNAVQPYNQYNVTFTAGDSYSDNAP